MTQSSQSEKSIPPLPEELRTAYTEENLVVFVGAGVSQAYPSCLPGFWELANEISRGTSKEVEQPLDQFLGRLAKSGVDVHEEAKQILDTDANPSVTHRAIVKLFGRPGSIRIVTTNFDRLLTKATAEVYNLERPRDCINHYLAPALPYGDDFSGIVHLHGSLDQSARRLILTDRDFGEAYVNRRWAPDFLIDLFSNYTILFVGYSHEDTIIKYLARSIPAEEKEPRLALEKSAGNVIRTPCSNEDEDGLSSEIEDESQPESSVSLDSEEQEYDENNGEDRKNLDQKDQEARERWQFLGVKPVLFPHTSGDDSFALLPETLEKWSQKCQRTGRDYGRLVSEVVDDIEDMPDDKIDGSHPISDLISDSENIDLKRGLQSKVGAQQFYKKAERIEWLYWMEQEDVIHLGTTDGDLPETQQDLREWITDKLARGEFSEQLLLHLSQKSKDIQRWAANSILKTFAFRECPTDADLRSRWLLWFFEHAGGSQGFSPYIELLKKAVDDESWEEVLLLLDGTLNPMGTVKPVPFSREAIQSTVSIKLPVDTGPLRNAWNQNIVPNLDSLARQLGSVLERHLIKVREIAQTTGGPLKPHVDKYAAYRTDVAEKAGNDIPTPVHILVDMAVGVLEWHVENDEAAALDVIDRWSASNSPLLQRTAIYGVEKMDLMTGEEKLNWILDRGWVLEPGLKQESGRVLEKAFPSASNSCRKRLLDSIDDRLNSQDQSWEIASTGQLLKALSDAAPEYEPVQTAWEEFCNDYPDVELTEPESTAPTIASRGLPDVDLIEESPSEIAEDIIEAFEEDPKSSNNQLLRRRVEVTLKRKKGWAKELAEVLSKEQEWGLYLWHPLLEALKRQTREDPGRLLNFINEHPPIYLTGRAVTRVLRTLSRQDVEDPPLSEHRDQIETIASRFLSNLREYAQDQSESVDEESFDDLIIVYRNIWLFDQGDAAQGDGLIRSHAEKFADLLSDITPISEAATRVLVAEIDGIHYVDHDWARNHLLPKFEWDNPEEAKAAWEAFLNIRRPSREILQELKDSFREAFAHLEDELDSEGSVLSIDRFIERMTVGALHAFNPIVEDWIIDFYNAVSSETQARWARELRVKLSQLDPQFTKEVWGTWLETYFDWRTRNKPVLLSKDEHLELFHMTCYLGEVFPEAVEYLLRKDPISLSGTGYLRIIRDYAPISRHPDSAYDLLQHIIEGWDGGAQLLGTNANKIIKGLIASTNNPEYLKGIINSLTDRGAISSSERDVLLARVEARNRSGN